MIFRALTRLVARRRGPRKAPSKLVAVVVPLSTRPTLSEDEQTSLRHLRHFLGRYDKYLVAPKGSPVRLDGFVMREFPRKYFGSLAAINNLWYSPGLFAAFSDYRFIFYYHLDCLVLSDQLEEWCAADLDYIGPPWIKCADSPWVTRQRVGNGGFVLVKVESALRVLYNRYEADPSTYWLDMFARNSRRLAPVVKALELAERSGLRSRFVTRVVKAWEVRQDPGLYGLNSDYFWSDQAVDYLPEFKVASLEQGLRFGFEVAPRLCLEMNNGQLPFGCHAWPRYDRGFWEPYLLSDPRPSVDMA
jgi:hypothetical protein